jgi:hypothetical protein
MKRSPRTAQVNFRISPELKKVGESAAADENRSLSSLLETLLLDHLKANGYLPKNGKPAGKRK